MRGYKKAQENYWNCLSVDERPFPPLYRVRTLGLNKSKPSEGKPINGHKGRSSLIQVGNPKYNSIRQTIALLNQLSKVLRGLGLFAQHKDPNGSLACRPRKQPDRVHPFAAHGATRVQLGFGCRPL